MAGQRKGKRSAGYWVKVGAAAVFVLVAGASTVMHFQAQKKEATEIAAAFTVTADPCPTLPAGVAPPPMPRQLQHEGVTYLRERGPVLCNAIRPNGEGEAIPVCMFPNAGTLRVQTAQETQDFALGGFPATVYVRAGAVQCVKAVNNALFAR